MTIWYGYESETIASVDGSATPIIICKRRVYISHWYNKPEGKISFHFDYDIQNLVEASWTMQVEETNI